MLLGTSEVAKELGVNPKTVWKWAKEGKIACEKLGKNYKIPQEEVEKIKQYGLQTDEVSHSVTIDLAKIGKFSCQGSLQINSELFKAVAENFVVEKIEAQYFDKIGVLNQTADIVIKGKCLLGNDIGLKLTKRDISKIKE